MKKTLFAICIVCTLSTSVLADTNEPILKVGDRWLIKTSDTAYNEATILESAKKGEFIRVKHEYNNIANPFIIWERTDDFQKTII